MMRCSPRISTRWIIWWPSSRASKPLPRDEARGCSFTTSAGCAARDSRERPGSTCPCRRRRTSELPRGRGVCLPPGPCLAGARSTRGDRVGIFMENGWQCAASIFGVLLAGGVFVTVNAQTKRNKLAFILRRRRCSRPAQRSASRASFHRRRGSTCPR